MQNITQTKTAETVEKLERARAALHNISRDVQIIEGRLLDFETADAMQRALHAALRTLDELTLTVAVMERRLG